MAKVPFNVSVFDLNHVLSQVDKTVDDLTQQEIEELYILTPIIKNLRAKADFLNAFFIQAEGNKDSLV